MEKKSNKNIIIGGLVSVGIILGAWYYSYWTLTCLPTEERGTFGDMFGGVNALFSGLALAGIIFTILLQRKELEYQREELSKTREEFKIQNKTLQIQRFENTFFSLLNLHHKIVDGIDFDVMEERKDEQSMMAKMHGEEPDYDRVTLTGRDVFNWTLTEFNETLKDVVVSEFNNHYMMFYPKVQTDFGHYYRNLYRMIKLVDKTEFSSLSDKCKDISNPTEIELNEYKSRIFKLRYEYTSMIRAQLSDFELLWIFYNCLSKNGFEKFKPLIEKYTLLKNIPSSKIASLDLYAEYENSAYEKPETVNKPLTTS